MTTTTGEIVHHLYARPGDLIPYCGALPGRDMVTGDWNAGHTRDDLLECIGYGLPACITCVSPEALGGFTPLILG